MPYNTTAIPPRRDASGTTQLPLSRVRRIIQVDQDVQSCSNAASFVIALATEMFIQYLAEQGHNVVKSERKPRRNIQYRDLSQAVHRNDNLEFLADIVPKTVPFKEIKEKKTSSTANNATTSEAAVETGQTTLDGSKVIMNGGVINGLPDHTVSSGSGTGNGAVDADDNDDSTIADPNEQLRMESRGVSVRVSNGSTVASNGHPASDDVEMQ